MTPYYIIAALAAVIVIMILWQWRHQRLLSLRAQLMREALHNHDFSFRLPTDGLLAGERDLQSALNDTGLEVSPLQWSECRYRCQPAISIRWRTRCERQP